MSVDYTQFVYVNRTHIQAIWKTDDFCNCNSNILIISKKNCELRDEVEGKSPTYMRTMSIQPYAHHAFHGPIIECAGIHYAHTGTSVVIIFSDSSIGYEGNILANNKKRTSFYR